MIKRQNRNFFIILLIAGVGIVFYWFFNRQPPANLNTDRVAFVATSSPLLSGFFVNYNVYVTNVDSPGLTQITWHESLAQMPTWSPNGDKIVYVSLDGLYMINADGSNQPQLIWRSSGRGNTTNPDWSPDGSKITFWEGRIYILDLETGRTIPLMDDAIRDFQPDWSPDGTKIAFSYDPSPHDGSIAVINVDGSDLLQLTTTSDNDRSPQWSPDGNQIMFMRRHNMGHDIYLMSADGTNVRSLTQDGKSIFPTWSPDGKRIAFVSLANSRCGMDFLDVPAFCTSELHVMNADGSNVVVIRSEQNENALYPAWAPRN